MRVHCLPFVTQSKILLHCFISLEERAPHSFMSLSPGYSQEIKSVLTRRKHHCVLSLSPAPYLSPFLLVLSLRWISWGSSLVWSLAKGALLSLDKAVSPSYSPSLSLPIWIFSYFSLIL